MNKYIIPGISVVIIVIVFGVFVWQAYKIYKLSQLIEKAISKDATPDATLNELLNVKDENIASIANSYAKTICIGTTENRQTNTPALELFSEFSTCNANEINLRLLDTAAGTLVGLGLLGTFLGLTLGVEGFDSSDTQKIQKSIQTLLSGMGTAFITSLVGMFLSMVFSCVDKCCRNRLSKQLCALANKLDSLYYIDDRTLDDMNEQALAQSIVSTMKGIIENEMRSVKGVIENEIRSVNNTLNNKLTYTNESGETTTVSNAIRVILTENQQQTRALKSFSTDLAIELNNGFDEALSRQMQQKILPLMENVDATTRAIVEHIDQMASQVASPATDMIQTVVDELRNSMSEMVKSFSAGLSGSATNELEAIAHQLGTAAQAMADFPDNMAHISSTLQVTIEEVRNAVSEISNTSASANSTAMQQMQEQITFATGAISNAISEVNEVMTGVTNSSQQQNEQLVNRLSEATERIGTYLTETTTSLSSS
ncbi:MAG: MotA/TolQ/ExbB proton channel family protein, partial [Prevotella sp.]|nr:MotA/TolQ/ExbB proton channel family protein [Prevotella sp.]